MGTVVSKKLIQQFRVKKCNSDSLYKSSKCQRTVKDAEIGQLCQLTVQL